MKKILFAVLAMCALNSETVLAADANTAQVLLTEMHQASQQSNYQLSYIVINRNAIEPLQYSHAVEENQQVAHLVYLSGPMREVIRRGNEVSYIDASSEPFTIRSNYMVAPTLPLLNSNIEQLSHYYDFIPLGKAREAGATCQVLRIVPKDGMRYSYILWVDENSKLPLRADLIDRNGDILEQFRTISFAVGKEVMQHLSGLKEATLPQVLSLPKSNLQQTFWKASWVPNGFKARELNRYKLAGTDQIVESQLFSDGLFDFSIYVSDHSGQSLKNQLVRQGRRTLQIFINGEHEVAVIGDIPPETAQRIARSVSFSAVKAGAENESNQVEGSNRVSSLQ